jgi:hypothetical protein
MSLSTQKDGDNFVEATLTSNWAALLHRTPAQALCHKAYTTHLQKHRALSLFIWHTRVSARYAKERGESQA